MRTCLMLAAVLLCLGGCGDPATDSGRAAAMDEMAREYLFLELGMGQHDPHHVDAYFGPEEIRSEALEAALNLDDIAARSTDLAARLESARDGATPDEYARIDGLVARLRALGTRIDIADGRILPFDDEAERLFGVRPPDLDDEHFTAILARIDKLLPGDGDLSARVEAYRERFEIPDDRLGAVMDAAIEECRRRTVERIELPAGESFTLAYVSDKPWGGYNWYQGNAVSLIEINTDLPVLISRVVGLGCHEGYPGHHTYNALLEMRLVREKRWIEFSLYPLFSPQSLLAEGTANYGKRLAFPGDERVEFEKTVLFPLAGLDASEADRFYTLLELMDELAYVSNEAAREYLNGTRSREETIRWLVEYGLRSAERAAQNVDFYDRYRSYVINYNLGQDLVRDYIERGDADAETRWQRFTYLLSSPVLPGDLQSADARRL